MAGMQVRGRTCLPVCAAALVVCATALLSGPTTALAAGGGDGCWPNRDTMNDLVTHRWDGYFVFDSIAFPNAEYTSGARADVLVYSPWVWYRPNAQKTVSDVTGYVMIDANTDAPTDYFQAGWIEFANGERHDYVEWSDNQPGDFTRIFVNGGHPWPINQYENYEVDYNPDNNDFTAYFDSDSSSWSTNMAFVPDVGEIEAETHTAADQMAGGYNFPEQFYRPQIRSSQDSSWHSPGNYGSDDTWWLGVDYQQALYSDHFSVWDPACAQ